MADPSLIGMPRGIRYKLLKSCLVIGVAFRCPNPRKRFKAPEASSQITRVCKLLYEDAVYILYSSNIICMNDFADLDRFISTSSPSVRSSVQHLQMYELFGLWYNTSTLLKLPNLRSLHVLGTDALASIPSFGMRRSGRSATNQKIDLETHVSTSLLPGQVFIQQIIQGFPHVEIGIIHYLPQKDGLMVRRGKVLHLKLLPNALLEDRLEWDACSQVLVRQEGKIERKANFHRPEGG